jgi:peroxiredoxin
MKSITSWLLVMLLAAGSFAAQPGEKAPDFTLTDAQGKSHSLASYAGKTVVLEWVNYDCPFVRKHYDANNMQALQKKWTEKGIVWLAINSSATGKQGHFSGDELAKRIQKEGGKQTAYLLDTNGDVGKLYQAKTTPHMYIIHNGTLVYQGAIDDKPTTKQADVAGALNYIDEALSQLSQKQSRKHSRNQGLRLFC